MNTCPMCVVNNLHVPSIGVCDKVNMSAFWTRVENTILATGFDDSM